jgi:hypothetical protein
MGAKAKKVPAAVLERIAQRHLALETLGARGSDSMDLPQVTVWGLRAALEAAYEAGRAAALAERK